MYAGAVAALLLALLFAIDGGATMRALAELAIPAGACFGAAFLLLATARRAGFTVLWALGLGLWAWMSFGHQPHGPRPGIAFFLWSVFALPLAAMTWVGFGDDEAAPARQGARLSVLVALLWAGLLTASVFIESGYGRALALCWQVAPLLVTAAAAVRIHRRQRSVRVTDAAAAADDARVSSRDGR